MVASGFAGLGYQIVWTQQCALWLGHESAAVLAVVTAFFGGLAAGALVLGPHIQRSARPERWYAGCELMIAAWSLALAILLAPVSDGLLPATAAMGATLPAMERISARLGSEGGRESNILAALYASNTFGAVLGVLSTAFWLVPEVGLTRTAAFCAALNLLCALVVLKLGADAPLVGPVGPVARDDLGTRPASPLAMLATTGLLGIGYEVLVVRVLSQVAEDTVYTFALLLAVYLVGTSAGSAIHQRRSSSSASARADADPNLTHPLLCLQAGACLVGMVSLWGAESIKAWLQSQLGSGMASALTCEALLGLAAFGLPTLVMGALFSHLALQARAAGHGFGRALGVNTLGATAAPLLFGVGLLPAVGPKFALLSIVAGYLVLALPKARTLPLFGGTAGATLVLALWAPPLAFIDVPTGGRVVSYVDGSMAAVSVVEDSDGVLRLRINNRQQEGSSATGRADARQALLPLLLHPAPQRVLFLGLGTGMTASAAARDATLQVDVAELLPEVIAASSFFTDAFSGASTRGSNSASTIASTDASTGAFKPALPDSRLRVIAADARRFVKTREQRYDVIVADNFHPARSGSGSLYTLEHFHAVRERLGADGLFCQWLPLHQLDLPTLRSIVRSFVEVYPGALAMLATNSLETPVLGLIGRREPGRLDLTPLRERLAGQQLLQRVPEYSLDDDFALLGGFIAGPDSLRQFAADAPLNTDDRPVVATLAPRITYAPDSLPRERLLDLLKELRLQPAELIDPSADAAFARRLAAYWAARDQFIAAGRDVRPSADPQRMLAQVRAPLLAVLRTSPDFRPARTPLQRLAQALQPGDPAAARVLLDELDRIPPLPHGADGLQSVITSR